MVRVHEAVTIAVATSVIILGFPCGSARGRETRLKIYPQEASADEGEYLLLPAPASLTDRDAAPLYEKAVKALWDTATDQQIRQWLAMPVDQLPTDRVEKTLWQHIKSLQYVARAVRCRRCNWPVWAPGIEAAIPEEYRRLTLGIQLWARLELSRAEYEGAVLALQTGFGMARQLGQAPALLQVQVGIATANAMCREIEILVQRRGAPNLCPALAGLPKPFVDIEKTLEGKRKVPLPGLLGRLLSARFESMMKPADDRTRGLAHKLDSDLAILQCVEAIRSHAASHRGQLPKTLAEITEVPVPKDPLGSESLRYTWTRSRAVLEFTVPAGGAGMDRTYYEIVVSR